MQEKELAARISMFLERDVCDRGAMEDLLALCLGAEDTQFAHQLNKEVRRYNTLALREDPRGNPWLYELRKKSLLFDAPVEFEAYISSMSNGTGSRRSGFTCRDGRSCCRSCIRSKT